MLQIKQKCLINPPRPAQFMCSPVYKLDTISTFAFVSTIAFALCHVKIEKSREKEHVTPSLVPRPHPQIRKGAWCYLQKFPYVLCQQSSFGVQESRLSISNY